jgi:hypothetical protein
METAREDRPGECPKSCVVEFDRLWQRLLRSALVVVLGPPGVGKSAYLRDEVIPNRPSGWDAVYCRPGPRPFARLASALAPRLISDPPVLANLAAIERPEVATAVFRAWRTKHDQTLLVLDRLERVFRSTTPELPARFATMVGRIATESGVHVLLTLCDVHLRGCHALEPRRPDIPSLPQEAALLSTILAASPSELRWASVSDS